MAEKALTIRVDEDLARRLGIHRAVTGETTNALVVRLLQSYLDGEGRQRVVDAAFDRAGDQYSVAIEKLA
jgi:plasmid stability protein